MRVYVAGPIDGSGDRQANIANAIHAADQLLRLGHWPYVPHVNGQWHAIHPHTHDEWMAFDLEWLAQCEALLRLPGVSPGADEEVRFARAHCIQVYRSLDELAALGKPLDGDGSAVKHLDRHKVQALLDYVIGAAHCPACDGEEECLEGCDFLGWVAAGDQADDILDARRALRAYLGKPIVPVNAEAQDPAGGG